MSAKLTAEEWRALSEACAFVGNSLLTPMTRTSAAGLDPAFWRAFPTFGDGEVAESVRACEDFARRMEAEAAAHRGAPIGPAGVGIETARVEGGLDPDVRDADDANCIEEARAYGAQRCAVEFTKLFVGPPSPAAAPWETMYRQQGAKVGFGQATFEMRELLREAGLELRNDNHQYEDHLGIEMLYLSVLCRRVADGLRSEEAAKTLPADPEGGVEAVPADSGEGVEAVPADLESASASAADFLEKAAVSSFVADHIESWVPRFQQRIVEAFPKGYFAPLVNLALSLARQAAR